MGFLGGFLGGALGWSIGGPIGGIIGFLLGSAFTAKSISGSTTATTQGDFKVSLLILIATVMKADGTPTKRELQEVKNFLVANFGEEGALEALQMLKKILDQNYDYKSVCLQINASLNYSSKLELLHLLFKISCSDELTTNELVLLRQMSSLMGISSVDFDSLRAVYDQATGRNGYRNRTISSKEELELAFQILEIKPDAPEAEIKKAYRRMAMKYHPDKVNNLGEDIKKTATEKFRAVNNAYETIKKAQGFA